MRVGLFIPCYVNQFYPQVAIATLELLEKFNCTVGYPLNQPVAVSRWRIRGTKKQDNPATISLQKILPITIM